MAEIQRIFSGEVTSIPQRWKGLVKNLQIDSSRRLQRLETGRDEMETVKVKHSHCICSMLKPVDLCLFPNL